MAKLVDLRPDVIGLSVIFQDVLRDAANSAIELRDAGSRAHITFGGHPPTLTARKLLETCAAVDSVVRGEGDISFPLLVQALSEKGDLSKVPGLTYRRSGEIVSAEPPILVSNLDMLPFPARDTLFEGLRAGMGRVSISSSRGCYGNCCYCSVSSFYACASGSKWRASSPQRVVKEIQGLVEMVGAKKFMFVDDNFIGPGRKGRRRAQEIAHLLAETGIGVRFHFECRANDVDEALFYELKQSGLYHVFLGIESGSPAELKYMRKGVTVDQNRKAMEVLGGLKIQTSIGYITFTPNSTLETVEESLGFLMSYGSNMVTNTHIGQELLVYPGAPVAEWLHAEGRLRGDEFGYYYSFPDVRVSIFASLWDRANPLIVQVVRKITALERSSRTPVEKLKVAEAVRRMGKIKMDVIRTGLSIARTKDSDLADEFARSVGHSLIQLDSFTSEALEDVITSRKDGSRQVIARGTC